MIKFRWKAALCFVAAVILFALWAGFNPPVSASAASDYSYTVESFDVTIDLSPKRVASVKEVITVSFQGSSSHGIIRDFPMGGDVRYQKIKATCDSADFSPYFETEDDFLCYYLRGSGIVTNQTRTYTITYEMLLPALSEEGYVPLDVIGYGWQTTIYNVTATLNLPNGFLDYIPYSGMKGTTSNSSAVFERQDNTITVQADVLKKYPNLESQSVVAEGISIDLKFEKGALSSPFDFTILYIVVVGVLLVLAAVLLKLFVARQPDIIKTVNSTPPRGMDPLLMGKLIDNKVDGEDLGALVFWLASKGYVTIDFENDPKDPVIFQTDKPLGVNTPAHIKTFYDGLFGLNASVAVSSLKNRFYKTAERVTSMVDQKGKHMYDKKSSVFTQVMLLLTVLLLGGFSFVYPLFMIGWGYYYFVMAIGSLFACVLPLAFVRKAMQNLYKWKKPKLIITGLAGIILGVAVGAFCCVFPSASFTVAARVLIVVFCALSGAASGTLLTITKEYAEELGQILGFKQFILFTERDKIKVMLEENPSLYYGILPYAQVLGVSDVWTNKFDGLNMAPPDYMRHHATGCAFSLMAFNSLSRSFRSGFSSAAVSRPSSSGGHSGGFGGGFGGGSGGGGFGGGGGRGC